MRRASILLALAVVAVACSGGDDDAGAGSAGAETSTRGVPTTGTSPTAEPPAEIPEACTPTPFAIDMTLDAVEEYAGSITVDGAAGVATPIVPNGDGSHDDLSPDELAALGADSAIVSYTQWIGNHPFGLDDLGWLSGPDTPDGKVTLALSVTATSPDGLVTGDVVDESDEFGYDSITTLASVSVFFQPDDSVETWFLVDNLDESQGGAAEILFVDDDWLCADWSLAGETRDPDGTYTINGVVLTPIRRLDIPLT